MVRKVTQRRARNLKRLLKCPFSSAYIHRCPLMTYSSHYTFYVLSISSGLGSGKVLRALYLVSSMVAQFRFSASRKPHQLFDPLFFPFSLNGCTHRLFLGHCLYSFIGCRARFISWLTLFQTSFACFGGEDWLLWVGCICYKSWLVVCSAMSNRLEIN